MSAVITNGYAAKRAIIDHLAQAAAERQGQPGLGQAAVNYSWPGNNGSLVQVFGGLVTFVQPHDDDLVDGARDVLVKEIATVSVHIRAVITPPPADGLQAVEELVEEIGDQIADELARYPHMAGGHSLARIVDGVCDEEPVDDSSAARMTMHIVVESYLTPA
jgi:hypothetical protein